MRRSDKLTIDSAEHANHVVMASKFGIFALNVPGRKFADRLDLNSIQDCRVQLLAAVESGPYCDPNDLAGLVFFAFVAETYSSGLT